MHAVWKCATTRHLRWLGLALGLVAMLALAAGADAAQRSSATVRFGRPDTAGPNCLPGEQCNNARDNIVPRTTVVSPGGTVTFDIQGRHHLAIYAPGTTPADIDPTARFPAAPGCPAAAGRIDDPDGRLFETRGCPPAGPSQASFTFNNPGQYLLICQVRPHFVDFDMYGWVHVQ